MTRKLKKRATALAAALFLLVQGVPARAVGTELYQNTVSIASDFTYTNKISTVSDRRTETFILQDASGGDVYPIVMACDTIYGGLTAANMIQYAERQGYNVLAAINTDFYSLSTGVPMGIVIENGVYKSSGGGRTAVAIAEDASACFVEQADVKIQLSNSGGTESSANAGKTVELKNFNKFRTDSGGLYLYDENFSTVSTRTSTDGWFVRLKILEGSMTVSGQMRLQVEELVESAKSVKIGAGYMILTAAAACGLGDVLQNFAVGDVVTLTTSCSDPKLMEAVWATGGGDVLAADGQVRDSGSWDYTIAARNPRTVIGGRADGTLLCMVVDGRNTGYSHGLTLEQTAQEMVEQGCVWVVNLDGGGSSVMSLRQPANATSQVVNVPSDGTPRKCAAYLLFVTDKVADGVPARLALSQTGAVVLAGAAVTLTPLAVDGGYKPTGVPGDTVLAAGSGQISGNVYTAPAQAGMDIISLTSASTGIQGSGTLHIVTTPTELRAFADDKAVTALTLKPGARVKLSAAAYWNGRTVLTGPESFSWSLEGEIGDIQNGVFNAADRGGTAGALVVRAGEATLRIPVKVSGFTDIQEHWSREYVEYLYTNGVVTGTTDTTFSPENKITRGDFILMLHRAAGSPAVSGGTQFTDVPANAYAAGAIAWAEKNGIAKGGGDGSFDPNGLLTREQAFTFVYRALPHLGISFEEGDVASLTAFADGGELSDYARVPAATLIQLGAVQGSDGRIAPRATLTRAQMAKILCVVLQER